MRGENTMKLKIAGFMLWAGGISALLIQGVGTFDLLLFGLLLTVAVLTIFAVKAFLMSGGDN